MTPHSATFDVNVSSSAADRRVDLRAEVMERMSITSSLAAEMYGLYARHYSDTTPRTFLCDLAGKTHVLVLKDAADRLIGFSTLQLYVSTAPGYPVRTIYSGDTIIDPSHWGSSALAFEWMRFAGRVYRQRPESPLYWLLIVKGHRTYRFLPTFAKSYVPHHTASSAGEETRLLNALAHEKFGADFNAATGVVQFASPQGRLNEELAAVPPHHLRLPEVAFFLARNPGYRDGDELVCVCELKPSNLRPRAARVFASGEAPPQAS
jgi:hypothetical protein